MITSQSSQQSTSNRKGLNPTMMMINKQTSNDGAVSKLEDLQRSVNNYYMSGNNSYVNFEKDGSPSNDEEILQNSTGKILKKRKFQQIQLSSSVISNKNILKHQLNPYPN